MKSGYLLKTLLVLCLCFGYVEAEPDVNSLEIRPGKETGTDCSSKSADLNKAKRKHVPKVEVYGRAGCPYCKKARAYFDKKDIPYKYYDVEKDKNAMKRAKSLTEYHGVPIVVIGKEVIEGYSPESYDDYIK